MADLVSKFSALDIKQPTDLSNEQKAIKAQWESVVQSGSITEHLQDLNLQLRDQTFILPGTIELEEVDVKTLEVVLPILKDLLASSKDITNNVATYRHIVRWALFILSKLNVDDEILGGMNLNLELPKEIIEKKKKEEGKDKAAPASAETKKETTKDAQQPRGKPDEETLKKLREEAQAKKAAKKAAKAQAQPQQQEAVKPAVSAIDFRVGFIQKCVPHENADSLYVSTIDCGDKEGPRTVCSGLVKYFPLEAMQERYVVVVCNLKPVNMRGVKSSAMVLCGSNDDKIEFVQPPEGSKPGDKVFFEGYSDQEPLNQLNPKKKIWEAFQPNFTTNENLEVIFKDEDGVKKLTSKLGQSFKVASIVNANVR
ncbi:hypothetical protein ACO0RG_003397 [Hanseniaspora osmophila]